MAEALKGRAKKIVRILRRTYPEVECALHRKNPFELTIATILSAQCTDKRVNIVTPPLFKKYPTPGHFAKAPIQAIEKMVRSTGFYKNKARSIKGLCQRLVSQYGGRIPKKLEELVNLPGIGRKTANVILGVAYGVPGVVVDTHVTRLTNRMGLTCKKDPVKIEFEMMDLIPKKDWIDFGLLLIAHGRAICEARKPKCEVCPVNQICPKIGV